MWKDVALLTVSCVLFVQMGLSDAVQERLRIRIRVLSCVKCSVFWADLVYMLVSGCRPIESVAGAFLCSYVGLWMALGYEWAALYYNRSYERITNQDTEAEGGKATTDAVS